VAQSLLKGVREMKESTTYQMIIEEGEALGRAKGRVDEARALVLRLGQRRFGAPPQQMVEKLNSIQDLAVLESIAEQIVEVQGWDQLLSK
jgi:predicted transposase YdaD